MPSETVTEKPCSGCFLPRSAPFRAPILWMAEKSEDISIQPDCRFCFFFCGLFNIRRSRALWSDLGENESVSPIISMPLFWQSNYQRGFWSKEALRILERNHRNIRHPMQRSRNNQLFLIIWLSKEKNNWDWIVWCYNVSWGKGWSMPAKNLHARDSWSSLTVRHIEKLETPKNIDLWNFYSNRNKDISTFDLLMCFGRQWTIRIGSSLKTLISRLRADLI
jgi:hypothetical protein